MHHTGNLLSDGFLQQPHMGALLVLLDQFPYGRLVQKGKGFNIVFGIFIERRSTNTGKTCRERFGFCPTKHCRLRFFRILFRQP